MKTPLIPIEALYSLVAVAESDTITQASQRIGRSQPALSMQLKKLEQQLGVNLLNRQGHRIELTEPGRLVLAHAREVLSLNQALWQTLDKQTLSGTLTFGMPSEFASQWLPKVLGRFTRHYPDVSLDVRCALSRDLARQAHDTYDLSLTLSRPARSDLTDELVWVGSQQHPISHQPLKLVAAPKGCIYREAAQTVLKKHQIDAVITYTNADFSGLLAAVKQGLGLTVLAKSTVPEDLLIIDVGLPGLGDIGIHVNFGSKPSDAALKLAEYMRQSLVPLV